MDQIERYEVVLAQRNKAIDAHAGIIQKNKELIFKNEILEKAVYKRNIIIAVLLFLLIIAGIALML